MDINESSAASDNIEKELEFICDNLRKRQKGVSALQNKKYQAQTGQGRQELAVWGIRKAIKLVD